MFVAALSGEEKPGAEMRKLPGQAREVLDCEWDGVARYRYADRLVVTSRGYNLSTAQEAALKLMETSYVVAQPFSEANLRHDPIAMVARDFPVLAIIPPGRARAVMVELVRTLDERGAELVAISEEEETLKKAAASAVPVSCPEELHDPPCPP